MSNPIERNRWEAASAADEARKARIAEIGVELMNAFNRGKTDPSNMAVLGHDTIAGFEFVIERDGETYVWSGSRDRAL